MTTGGIQTYNGYRKKFVFNIDTAMRLVAGREPEQQDITRWFAELPNHGINDDHWPGVDLSEPLILAPLYDTGELWLIDGWHRIHKAQAEGVTVLPVHVLSVAEERRVRDYGGDKQW